MQSCSDSVGGKDSFSHPAECCPLAFTQVVTLADYDRVEEVTREGAKKSPSPGYPLVCVTPCDPHFPKYALMKERCSEAGINQSSIQFSWEVAAPTDGNGARSPFETITDSTPFTSVNHRVQRLQPDSSWHLGLVGAWVFGFGKFRAVFP